MLGVTADSNIYISALHFAGIPRQFLNAARAGLFRLAVSDELLEEVHRVLRRKFQWSEAMLEAEATYLARFIERVRPMRKLDVIKDDPDDNRVLECAEEAGSRFIVSGDGDLLRLGQYQNIRIVKVAEFMKMMPTL